MSQTLKLIIVKLQINHSNKRLSTNRLCMYRVCHGFRSTNRDVYFQVNYGHYLCDCYIWGNWSSDNGLELRTKPPQPGLACPNLWNASYVFRKNYNSTYSSDKNLSHKWFDLSVFSSRRAKRRVCSQAGCHRPSSEAFKKRTFDSFRIATSFARITISSSVNSSMQIEASRRRLLRDCSRFGDRILHLLQLSVHRQVAVPSWPSNLSA